jgi:hypothetical protein
MNSTPTLSHILTYYIIDNLPFHASQGVGNSRNGKKESVEKEKSLNCGQILTLFYWNKLKDAAED